MTNALCLICKNYVLQRSLYNLCYIDLHSFSLEINDYLPKKKQKPKAETAFDSENDAGTTSPKKCSAKASKKARASDETTASSSPALLLPEEILPLMVKMKELVILLF